MEPGTQVFVNWYGHVCAGTVLDKQKANFSGEIWKDWIAISMQVPASDGKPIVAGCHNICAYHKKHVYDTSEAAATAWREFQIRSQQTKPEPAAPVEAILEPVAQPDSEDWLADSRAFLKAHWNHERNHIQVDAIPDYMRIFRADVCRHIGYKDPEPVTPELPKPVLPAPELPKPELPKPVLPVPEPVEPKHAEPAGNYAQKQPEIIRRPARRKKKREESSKYIQLSFDF
jgi:hypothetical protein